MRTAVVVAIVLAIASAHAFRVGTYLGGSLSRLYYSYFSDVAIPFCMYLLLCLRARRLPLLADWRARALLVFGIASFAEVMQAFGVPLLGRTFDPLDFAMFAVGVALGAIVDRVALARLPGARERRPKEA